MNNARFKVRVYHFHKDGRTLLGVFRSGGEISAIEMQCSFCGQWVVIENRALNNADTIGSDFNERLLVLGPFPETL